MQLSFFQMLRQQLASIPPVKYEDLSGKTVVVIGANNGIGFEATKHFARMNPDRLILGCRSKERGEAAVTKLEAETGYKSAELWVVDLARISSVVDFTNRFEKEGGRLDILLENAGIIQNPRQQLTTDGYEPVFQVNNLCTSLLALRLLPIMLRTANKHHTIPRLVVVSSEVHYWVELEKYVVESPNGLEKFGKLEYSQIKQNRYMESKLLNVFFARGLNERVGDKPLIVNTVNPGYCYSSIRSGFTGLRAWADWLMEKAIARTSEEGSRQLIWACLGGNDNVDELRGAYVSALHVQEPSDYVVGEEGKRVQDKLWDALIDELAKSDPSVWEIVEKYLTSP
ncbi:retinol dehydrogenase 12 [Phlegmacium glaucopus]|nr:retinol dehydrogenase 12 [Phlegmacium glaucopus]